jgi:transposase InsO family protein
MAYSLNPNLPKVRRDAVNLVKYKKWSIRKVAKHFGYSPSTVSRWCKHPRATGWIPIPTESSRPKTSPKALNRDVVKAIIDKRNGKRRCGQVIHEELRRENIKVSLSSVQRTLDRCHLLKKRSPRKRPHDYTSRPKALYSGALLQCDTVHIIAPDGSRIYLYTLIDLYSRWAYAEAVSKIGANPSVEFIERAQKVSDFKFEMIQTDNGPEFTKWCTNGWRRLGIKHRHGRVRKSNDQAHVERFNRTIQEECTDLTSHSLKSFKKEIPKFLNYYNNERLHMGINFQTPQEVLQRC